MGSCSGYAGSPARPDTPITRSFSAARAVKKSLEKELTDAHVSLSSYTDGEPWRADSARVADTPLIDFILDRAA